MKRSHESKNIYRTREEMRMLREAVLDAWASGEDGGYIAERLGITRAYLDVIVRRARAKGDERADRRYRETDSYGWRRVVHGPFGERVWSLHVAGKTPVEIAVVVDRDVIAVISEISRQQLDRTGHRRTRAEMDQVLSGWGKQHVAHKQARAQLMKAARRNGVTPQDIAQTFGVALGTVYHHTALRRL